MVTHTRLTSTRYVNCLKQGCRQMQGMTGGPLFNTCVLRGSTTLVTAWRTAVRYAPTRSRPARQHRGAAPVGLGPSPDQLSSMLTNLVAFPLGFWVRAPLGLIVVRHGRGMQSPPADEWTCGGASRMTRRRKASMLILLRGGQHSIPGR